jgi:cbb3-type cytochrome oxidase subunit 1
MINGKMTMSGEFGSIRVETVVTYIKLYSTFYIYMIKQTQKWQDIVDILHITQKSAMI